MKSCVFLVLFFASAVYAFAQPSQEYQADLQVLYATLQKTPSYKQQIKRRALKSYQKLYDSLSRLNGDQLSSLDYFSTLSQLFFPLRDNHLGFYEVYDVSAFSDTVAYRKFKEKLEATPHPSATLDVDSLATVLSGKSSDEIEGIYHYEKYYSVGLYKISAGEYEGIILSSQVPFWKKGQVIAKLYEYAPYNFRAIYANPLTKTFHFYPNERFGNQALLNSYFYVSYSRSNYKKNLDETDFVNLSSVAPAFQLKNLQKDIQYLRLGNFSASTKAMEVSDTFYQSIKDSLTARHLIVDLRNNTGGAEKVSKKFKKLIKRHARRSNVYVLVNNGTISQGEIFLLQLSRIKNIKTYGQTTQGKIAYGSNYGKRVKLPSGKAEVYITDMRDWFGRVKYENAGIQPQVVFDNSSDWIERLLAMIAAQ